MFSENHTLFRPLWVHIRVYGAGRPQAGLSPTFLASIWFAEKLKSIHISYDENFRMITDCTHVQQQRTVKLKLIFVARNKCCPIFGEVFGENNMEKIIWSLRASTHGV